jgi:inosose dehydratase
VHYYGLQVTTDWIGTRFSEKDQYSLSLEKFKESVNFLEPLGVKALKVCECGHSIQNTDKPIFNTHVEFTSDQWQKVIHGLHEAGEFARSKGMYIAYHQHLGTGVQNQESLEYLLAKTDPHLVTLLPDTGHFLASGMDPFQIISKYIKRVFYIHLKDVRLHILKKARQESFSFMDCVRAGLFTVPGDGILDFAPILKLLKTHDFNGWAIVEAEQDPNQAPPLEYALKAKHYLDSHMSS